ncbi:thioredoxin family protein [Nitratiruptor tergarcus]|uniref:Highly conserved protein containing a thioredoxin domain n=1 Tax=Nitratiruptor tergarcus DSM 16512 TaxID=1069081 RepID=A0A1W1WT58_9BACT|nr:thioredoxin family protein [Nitratiruptor tergarcus]SMC09426.1 Highly conserved protein containing a thioredoxin domain [Nitratiruptor tergarcus DSM 16512]
MKKIVLLISFVLLAVAADFDWVTYNKALAMAKKLNKPIMIMISQKGCPTCEYMDDVAFENDELVDFVEYNFIPVKIDLSEAKKLGFKAYGTPTFYFLRPNGKPFEPPLVGGATAKVFLDKLKEIKADYGH